MKGWGVKFPSPLGVIFSLIVKQTISIGSYTRRFPSPLGVIFSLIKNGDSPTTGYMISCFRLLSELYSLLCIFLLILLSIKIVSLFPSPLGVIFSLIHLHKYPYHPFLSSFPSPLGVIFSLICLSI